MHRQFVALTDRYPDLAGCVGSVESAFVALAETYRGGGKLLVCGNGGSAADCEHIVGELMKGFRLRRPLPDHVREQLQSAHPSHGEALADSLQGALPALSLVSQSALLTATANDIAADMVFAQQVYGYGARGDAVLGISTSGTSRNVLNALRVGRALGLRTVGLTGKGGGLMPGLCDLTICVPYDDVATIQERHLPIYHALCAALEEEFFGP